MEKRLRWFDEGASALRLLLDRYECGHALPPTGSYYVCPCCLVAHSRAAVTDKILTIEDVPPKALGGRPMLLTCGKCNHSSGHNFDAAAAQKAIADAFVHGRASGRPVGATSRIDGIPLRGEARSTENGISFMGIPKQNHPKDLAAYKQALNSLVGDENPGPRISLTVDTRFSEKHARLSLIRAAYLASFAALGWSYALRSAMQPIRDQLQNPDAQLLDTYIFQDPDCSTATRRVLLVNDPEDLECVVVMLGEYSVFLPGLRSPMTWDDVAAAFCRRRQSGDRLNVNLRGKEVPWPRSPTYLLD